MTWRTFRQRQARRRLNYLRTLEQRTDLHAQRLDAQSRTLVAMSGRIDLSETVAGRLEQLQNDLDARLQVVEELIDQLLTAPADLVATLIDTGGSSVHAVPSAAPMQFCRCGGWDAAATRSAAPVPSADESKEAESNMDYFNNDFFNRILADGGRIVSADQVATSVVRAKLAAAQQQLAAAQGEVSAACSEEIDFRCRASSVSDEIERRVRRRDHLLAEATSASAKFERARERCEQLEADVEALKATLAVLERGA